MPSALGGGASLFGKLPSELDFVRMAHDTPEAMALERFLQSALQRLAANKLRWPHERLAFVMAASASHSLVGTLTPSRDRAGRCYPLAIYMRLPGSATLPLACERLLEQAAELSDRSQRLPLAALGAAVRALPPPSTRERAQAEGQLSRALERSIVSMARALYPSAAAPAAALRGALTQLGVARARSGSPIDGFSYPIDTASDISVWAHALERIRGQHGASSALWRPGAQGRVLLTAGPLPERALLYTTASEARHPRLCRDDDHAHDQVAAASEPTGQIGELIEQIVQGRAAGCHR